LVGGGDGAGGGIGADYDFVLVLGAVDDVYGAVSVEGGHGGAAVDF